MSALSQVVEPSPPAVLHMPAACMTDGQFLTFCQANPDWRFERTAHGDIVIMPPAYPETGYRNADLITQLSTWARRDRTGRVFDSSTGFKLSNGATRSPDASWILRERLDRLTKQQKQKFWQICPDFVAELRSATDHLPTLKAKLREYIDNGASLGWLLDPESRRTWVYEGQREPVCHEQGAISGDPVLAGFALDASALG